MKCFKYFVVFLILYSYSSFAASSFVKKEYSYKLYTVADGMPTSVCYGLYQDSRGFIWIGCENGFSRFDGFTFKNYFSNKLTETIRINEDSHHNVRAFCNTSMHTIDSKTDSIRVTSSPNKDFITSMHSLTLPNNIGIFTSHDSKKKYFVKIEDNKFNYIFSNQNISSDLNRMAYPFIFNGLLYIPTIKGIIVNDLSGKFIKNYPELNVDCFVNYEDKLCAIGQNGIYRLTAGHFEKIVDCKFPEKRNLLAITDKEGALVVMDGKNVYKLEKNCLKIILETTGEIRHIMADNENNLWVATEHGLYCMFRLTFTNYYLSNPNEIITCTAFQSPKRMIIGSNQGNIYINENNQLKRLYGNPNQCIVSKVKVSDSHYLFAALNDVIEVKNEIVKSLHFPELNTKYLACMMMSKDDSGNFYTETQSRLIKFDKNGHILSHFSDADLKQAVRTIPCFDQNGTLWIGGEEGITKIFANGKISVIKNDCLEYCTTMTRDEQKNIWFGSENRLYKIVNNSIVKVKEFESLIRNIFITKSHLMVVAVTNGIYIFSSDLKQQIFYNSQNGYIGKEASMCDIEEDEDGNVYLPATRMLVSFNPQKMLHKQYIPQLNIVSIKSSSDNLHWQEAENCNSLQFNSDQTNLHISYIGISFSQENNVRYQYRLVGLQKEWSQPTAEREVGFNNLRPGHYVFELKANGGTPDTQTKVISVSIYIHPAFWQTWIFRVFLILIIAFLIALFSIKYQRRKQQKEIKKANREKEINELRIQSIRLKSIPHFNSNVLAGIEYLMTSSSKEDANELFSIYTQFTNITLEDIDKAKRTLKKEITYAKLYLELEKMRYGDKLIYIIDVDKDVNDNIMIPNMVLHTYAENAIKHGIRGKNGVGKIVISIKSQDKGVCICVQDDGVGRAEAAKRNQGRQGHGLTILTRQIELYNQQNEEKIVQTIVDLQDQDGLSIGTRFELCVPYNYQYL